VAPVEIQNKAEGRVLTRSKNCSLL